MRRALVLVAAAFGAALFLACPESDRFPGDLVVGTYDFGPTLANDGCTFEGSSAPGAFSGTVSVDTKTGRAFLTVGTAQLEGTLDGDHLTVHATASRDLPSPCGCSGTLDETIEGDLLRLDPAQVEHAECGTVRSTGADGGTPDALTADPVLFCGRMVDHFSTPSGATCRCEACDLAFFLSGHRH